MLNIVIPMAGKGSRFANAGFTDPKPLIQIHGMPMIQLVIANLRPNREHRFIFICQREHYSLYKLDEMLPTWAPNHEVILLDGITEGAACTVLTAKHLINSDDALMIANSDQFIDTSIDDYLNDIETRSLDGLIMTMKANDPKWSFAATDANQHVTNVVEKEPISDDATVGIYNFSRGRDFVSAAENMIAADERVNGEFYVAPAYNRMIKEEKVVGIYSVGSEANGMYGLGTPADLALFINHSISRPAVENAKWK
ncbi:glycosyltransferase family 2 protein [Pseudomonas sp. P155]|uniref:Glycosyltransferase family 2 protein n=1 Tax=Pseudomonas neuropathica TaxID=2730425 RepID=A0ABS0BFQ3_9PSED|nr:glycosyltransferase family 2 protein [Pseudomonas neuropathica]MBF6033281.1 glycosyltransferase family 2 protein [Pseudomonas neuropathica]